MPGKSDVEAAQIAEIIKNSVPLLRFKEHPDLQVTISQGVCRANFGTEAAQALGKFDDFIKLADDELYRAKLEGRNRICTKLVP
jgi:PleD family two-component response regulator